MRRLALVVLLASGCGKSDPKTAEGGPTEAQRLLAEAGFPGGKGFPRLSLVYNTSESHKRIAAAIQQSWRKQLGIEIELVNTEWKVFLDRVERGEFEVARRAWIGEYLDPHAFLDLFTRESGQNPTGWSSDEYERLIRVSDVEKDPAERQRMLEEAEQLLLREAPMFPIYHYVAHNFLKPFVKGVYPNSRDLHPIQHAWLEGDGAPKDGVLVFNAGEEPGTLDPALSHDIAGLKVLMHLFEGLFSYDPRDASPVPAVAERWEVSEDGKTWTFHLRPSNWSNGDPVTADDFVYAWRRVLQPETASTYSQRLFLIRGAREIAAKKAGVETLGARAPDPQTLVVELTHPAPYLPQLLCLNLFYPVHRATVEKAGRSWMSKPETLVGNGPYRMTSWTLNDRKIFEKNPTYRTAAEIRIKRFVFVQIADAAAGFRAYEAGQVHWLFQAPPEFMDSLLSRPDHLHNPANAVYFYVFNTKKKPLDDSRVRRALGLAIDREKICTHILRGGETPASRIIPPTSQSAAK
jgi:ABC-type oligopeptide transport system substrate-binding subunit